MPSPSIQKIADTPDTPFDVSLRPPMFSEFAGQEKVCQRFELMVQAAQQRGDVLDHILLSGPPGLGKTTLANIIANAMGVNVKSTSGPTIEKAGDLAGLLTNLEEGDVLFIDEIHRLQKNHRGISLSRDGGLQTRHHHRPGTERAQRPIESAAIHPHRRDDASRDAQRAACSRASE